MARADRIEQPDEATLIAQSCSGNSAAFARLVQRYEEPLARFTYRLVGRVDLAEDLRQEALLRAFISLRHLQDRERFGAWLFGIAANLAKWWWRRQERWPVSWEGLATEYPDVAWERKLPGLPQPEQIIEEAEQSRRLQEAIVALPADLARPLVLHYLDGLSYAEIAEALAVPLSTVKGRLFKSRSRLRQTLGIEFRPVSGERQTKPRRHRRKEGVTAMTPIDSPLIRVVVDRVYSPTEEPTVDVGLPHIVLREADGSRELPIVVGKNEAIALALHQQGQTTPRPLSYDLMKTLTDAGELVVKHVAVTRLAETTYHAIITVQQPGGGILELDARPSDAINLAVRADAPIVAAEQLLWQVPAKVGDRAGGGTTCP